MASDFGFEFVENVPAPPKPREHDTERWNAVKLLLGAHPGTWVKAKVWAEDKNRASVYAGSIRGDRMSKFPADEFDARSGKTPDGKGSILYLSFIGDSTDNTDDGAVTDEQLDTMLERTNV